MEQLIEITTVPIKYQLKVQNASLNYKSSLAEVEITRDQGEMKIRSKPIKLSLLLTQISSDPVRLRS